MADQQNPGAQLRERRRNFTRRIEAIDRIQQATGGLEERIGEIENHGGALNQLDAKLFELTEFLMASEPRDKVTEVDVELV